MTKISYSYIYWFALIVQVVFASTGHKSYQSMNVSLSMIIKNILTLHKTETKWNKVFEKRSLSAYVKQK